MLEKYMSRGFVIGIPNADFFILLNFKEGLPKNRKVGKSQPGEVGY